MAGNPFLSLARQSPLLDEDDSLRNTDRMAMRRGAKMLKQVERSHRAQAMPAARSGGARRSEDAVRRTIDNVIDGSRAEQWVLSANRQPGDGAENRVTRLRKIHQVRGCGRNGIALAALRPRTDGPLFGIVRAGVGHRIVARHPVTSQRLTAVTCQIIATSGPRRTCTAETKSRQTQRQQAASEQEPLQRLNTLPPHEMSSGNVFVRPITEPTTPLVLKLLGLPSVSWEENIGIDWARSLTNDSRTIQERCLGGSRLRQD